MIKIRLKKYSLNEILTKFGTLLLMVLIIFYMNNAYRLKLYSTQWLQISILLTGVFLLLINHRYNKFFLVAFLLSATMLITSIIYSVEIYGLMGLISKTFLWFFVMILGYEYGKKKKYDNNNYIIIVTVFIMIYIYCSNTFFDFSVVNKNYVQTSIYYLICMLPFVLLISNHKIRFFLVNIIIFLSIISFKRSAIIVLFGSIFVVILIDMKNNVRKLLKYVLLIIGIFLAVFVAYVIWSGWNITDLLDILNVWNNRFGESGSREIIYLQVIEKQMNSSGFEWFLGHGYNAVMNSSIYGLSAHCDYLEILYNYGIIAEILFMYMIVFLIKRSREIKKINLEYARGYVCSIVIFIIASLPSHMLTYSTYFLLLSFFWGYTESIYKTLKG